MAVAKHACMRLIVSLLAPPACCCIALEHFLPESLNGISSIDGLS
jgi:hypothetical protein